MSFSLDIGSTVNIISAGRRTGKSQFVERIMARRRNPFQYLYDLAHSDRSPEYDEHWMTARLQQKWPGNYHVAPRKEPEGWTTYHIVFDTPQDETWFRLQYV